MERFIAYRRVSTLKQERSGLGLEDQDKMINDYVRGIGGTVVDRFVETESGKLVDRPQLRRALAAARKHKAVLLVAKLDRLARNVAFVSALLETPGVEFRAADMPSANRMMIQMLAVFAEYEREQIAARTKAAMGVRKARGLPCGRPENLDRSGAPEANKAKARAVAERLRPVVESIRREGVVTVRGICEALNSRGYVTETGSAYHPTSVARVLSRLN